MTDPSLFDQVSRDSLNSGGSLLPDLLLRPRCVDKRVQHEAQGQSNPEAEQRLDRACRTRGELGAVILFTEVVPVLLARRPRVFLGHSERTLPEPSDIVKRSSSTRARRGKRVQRAMCSGLGVAKIERTRLQRASRVDAKNAREAKNATRSVVVDRIICVLATDPKPFDGVLGLFGALGVPSGTPFLGAANHAD